MKSSLRRCLIVIAAFLCFIGCVVGVFIELKQNRSAMTESAKETSGKAVVLEQAFLSFGYLSKVEFSGHTYILFSGNGTGMTHDPDCKCHGKHKEQTWKTSTE